MRSVEAEDVEVGERLRPSWRQDALPRGIERAATEEKSSKLKQYQKCAELNVQWFQAEWAPALLHGTICWFELNEITRANDNQFNEAYREGATKKVASDNAKSAEIFLEAHNPKFQKFSKQLENE